ncbi:hypothetical protein SAMN06296416_108174 [Pseudoxanthomonas wuyuanensis]|uniref:Uncharacterized protein n=1 Tax=Pseudoxanthomonas wuyuanensis TaxID=1073196 RepID=A0A286DBV3_9GAMM|nr:hypothetical protein [Pseudoxanthomonas wuyuanensis]SOD56098.1 hypothetical protein SAMN06296416_108174 [Pseudoxanthomonas wuyuanensis]
MATDRSTSQWRNFAVWSAAGALFYVLAVWGVFSLVSDDSVSAMFRSKEVAALVGLGLLFSMACVGFSSRKRPVSLRTLRNFLIRDGAAVVVCLLVMWGLGTVAGAGTLGASEWVAAVTGAVLLFFAILGILVTASAHTGADLIDDPMAGNDLRERGRLIIFSFVWMAACGLLLILLGLAGPGGVLSPVAALAGALVLIAVLVALGIAVWRLNDELDRTLSHEAGNLAFYLVLALGGGWAMLAQLGFAAAPAPLDWLTLFTVLMFVASFVAVGRRRLLAR